MTTDNINADTTELTEELVSKEYLTRRGLGLIKDHLRVKTEGGEE